MKRIFLTVLLFNLLLTTTVAQNFIVDTEKLNNAYAALEKEPQNIRRQKDFFSAFPSCWNDFYSTYRYCDKDGYDLSMYNYAYAHIQALGNCTAINDTVFCNRLIALSVGASLDADAPNHLQTLLHNTMQENVTMKKQSNFMSVPGMLKSRANHVFGMHYKELEQYIQ